MKHWKTQRCFVWERYCAEKHALLRRKKRTRNTSRRQFGSRFQLFNIILLSLSWGLPHACQLCNDIIVWSSYMNLTREFETNSWMQLWRFKVFFKLMTYIRRLRFWNYGVVQTASLRTCLQHTKKISTTYLEVANVWIMGLSNCKFVYTYRAGFMYVCILTELVGLK